MKIIDIQISGREAASAEPASSGGGEPAEPARAAAATKFEPLRRGCGPEARLGAAAARFRAMARLFQAAEARRPNSGGGGSERRIWRRGKRRRRIYGRGKRQRQWWCAARSMGQRNEHCDGAAVAHGLTGDGGGRDDDDDGGGAGPSSDGPAMAIFAWGSHMGRNGLQGRGGGGEQMIY
ncbi:hypothetical protein Syun_007098 [Stephania yunnanensis]|uniref:Uncharacterized protein n=1 Tax=Stephania yunnanensis TaxID=152371 RepID=A0AAP0KZL4_9MAGN